MKLDTWEVMSLIVSFPLLTMAAGLLHQAACALSDREVVYWRATFIGALTFFPTLGLTIFLTIALGEKGIDKNPEVKFTTMHALGMLAGIGVMALVGSVAYTLVFQGAVLKAIQVSIIEVLLRILLAVLVGALVLVGLACGQIWRDPDQRFLLYWAGGGFGAFVLVVAGIFLVVALIRRGAQTR